MARKASDLFSLLQSRGKGRGGSSRRSGSGGGTGVVGGALGSVVRAARSLFGGSRTDVGRGARASGGGRTIRLSGVALAGIAFVCLGVGYLLGDAFPMTANAALRAGPGQQDPGRSEPVRPGPIDGGPKAAPGGLDGADLAPLTNQVFFLTVFGDGNRQKAFDLAAHLQRNGVASARPYWHQDGSGAAWLTVAYYDGPAQARTLRDRLLAVPALPAVPEFESTRKTTKDWPLAVVLR